MVAFRFGASLARAVPPLLGLALSLGATSCIAQADASEGKPDKSEVADKTIKVNGDGEVKIVPDLVRADLGVETEGATAAAAVAENEKLMNKLVEAMKAAHIEPRDMQTRNFSVQHVQPPLPPGTAPTPGKGTYRVTSSLAVTIRDLKRASEIFQSAIDAGANQASSLTFGVTNSKALEAQARERAVATARLAAEALARAAGVAVGEVVSIADSSNQCGIHPMAFAARAAGADVGPPIEAGELTVTAHVDVVFAIAPRGPSLSPLTNE
jgi:uncharacterized protein YggE